MRPTVAIDGEVMRRLEDEAARRGVSVEALVETAVCRYLDEDVSEEGSKRPNPWSLRRWHLGQPRVDIANREALYEFLEEDDEFIQEQRRRLRERRGGDE